jgi:phosphatidylglycerophosphate synthase
MPELKSLTRSIVFHGALFCLAQGAVLLVMTVAYRMGWPRMAIFLGIVLVYHAFLTAILLLRRGDFRVEASGRLLSRVNLSNTLTYIRLSSLPTILFLVIQAADYPSTLTVILPFICIVFATDFLDGMTARRRGEITFVGRYLDSASDYLTIIAVTIVLYYYGLLALWFLVLVLVRLVLFAVGMALLALREGKANPLATFLGKVSIFSLMVLYAMEIARLFSVPWIGDELVVSIMSYVVAVIVVVSMVDKAIFLGRRFSRLSRISARSAHPRRSAP